MPQTCKFLRRQNFSCKLNMAEGLQDWWRLTELSPILTDIFQQRINGGFLEVFLYNFKSAWGLVLERLLGMVLDEISKPRWWKKSDNVKDSSKLKFYTVLHEELYAKWRIVITTRSDYCRRLPKNVRRFPLLGNGPAAGEFSTQRNTKVFAPGKHIAHAEKVRTYKGYWNPQRKTRVATHFSR